MGMSGADIVALDALAAAFADAVDRLGRLRSSIVFSLNSVYWEGPDALAVREECRRSWEPMLDAAAGALAEAQRALVAQVRQQLDASDGSAMSPGLGVVGAGPAAAAWGSAIARSRDVLRQALAESDDPQRPSWEPVDPRDLARLPAAVLDSQVRTFNAAPADPSAPWPPPRAGDSHCDWTGVTPGAADPGAAS